MPMRGFWRTKRIAVVDASSPAPQLSDDVFHTVVDAAPLVAIDLVVVNDEGQMLLGLRHNRPAQGFWFVPGGRIRKGESLDKAFARITEAELGLPLQRQQASLLGLFEHHYQDSVFGPAGAGPSTHYVVLPHHICLTSEQAAALPLPTLQHGSYRWQDLQAMRRDEAVHENTRAYIDSVLNV